MSSGLLGWRTRISLVGFIAALVVAVMPVLRFDLSISLGEEKNKLLELTADLLGAAAGFAVCELVLLKPLPKLR